MYIYMHYRQTLNLVNPSLWINRCHLGDEIGQSSADEIVSDEWSPVRRALLDLAPRLRVYPGFRV